MFHCLPSLRPVLLPSFSAHWSSLFVAASAYILPSQTAQRSTKKTKKKTDRQKSRTVSGSEEIHFQFSPKATLKGKEKIKEMKIFISNCVFFLQTTFFLPAEKACVSLSSLLHTLVSVCVCALVSVRVCYCARRQNSCYRMCNLAKFFTSGCQWMWKHRAFHVIYFPPELTCRSLYWQTKERDV